jgi:chemotaxis protein MotB
VNHERWLVTYADMLTLLMVLFIVLFAMGAVDQKKYALLREGLAAGFGAPSVTVGQAAAPLDNGGAADSEVSALSPGVNPNVSGGGLPNAHNQSKQQSQDEAAAKAAQAAVQAADLSQSQKKAAEALKELNNLKEVVKKLNAALKAKGVAGAVSYSIDQRGLVVTILTSGVIFGGNSAALEPEGQLIIGALAPALTKLPNDIEVDGHTNQLQDQLNGWQSGWELSSARASAVVSYLIGAGIPKNRMSAVGYADTRPLYPPSDPRAVTRNRRVEIIVLSSLPADERAIMAQLAK